MSVALCLLAGGGLLAACGDDESDSTESQQMTLVAPKIEIEATDLGEQDASRGDLRAFAQEVFEEGNTTEPVGRLDGAVQITDIDETVDPPLEYRPGQIQFTLDEGTLVAAGTYVAEPGVPVPAEGGVDRPIVGGTGAYEGASGVVSATADGDGVRYELSFETKSDDD
jgi:hypothetical protein